MRYLLKETPYIVGKFATATPVTIDIWDIGANLQIVDGAATNEIGSTGYYSYSFKPEGFTKDCWFLYIMSDGSNTHSGMIYMGGYVETIPTIYGEVTQYDNYKADVRTLATEETAGTILSEVQNYDNYKANVSGLATEDNATGNKEEILNAISGIDISPVETLVNDIAKLTGNKVTKAGDLITIFDNDGVTPWRVYDLSNGGRVQQ